MREFIQDKQSQTRSERTSLFYSCSFKNSQKHLFSQRLYVDICFEHSFSSNTGTVSTDLMEVTVNIINEQVCNSRAVYNGIVTKNMLCAGHLTGGKDSCQVSIRWICILCAFALKSSKLYSKTYVKYALYFSGGQWWTVGVSEWDPLVPGGDHQLGWRLW